MMVKTANWQETVQTLKSKIAAIYEYLLQNGDLENAEKIKQLAKKLEDREFMIAFCGHFSAGKSTMINQVIGEKLLPSSPIPTSANLVKVKTGEEYAKVFFKNEKSRLYLAPYDYQLVKNYCKDGDQIEKIEISHSESHLPPNTVIMDTPGIDSADDAHRIATESAIFLADIVLYVMDYNHVQSELNLIFTKELMEAGKEVYLVINQIDKHKDEELSFKDFQKSVLDSFASWGVKPAHIFYTSLKQPDYIYNEFNQLQQFLTEKLKLKEQNLIPSISRSLKKIGQDHIKQSRKTVENELQPWVDLLQELTEGEKQDLLQSYQKSKTSLETITNKVEETENDFDHAVAQIVKNAYLMPFQTRALAEDYLASCQLEFKVGFLFSKQKTKVEKGTRLERFYQEILEKVKSQFEWHLREFLFSLLKENALDQGELLAKAQSFSIPVPVELLVKTVKPGARLSGEYVLHYTEDVANEIKKIARKKLVDFKDSFLDSLKEKTAKLKKQYEEEFRRIEQFVNAVAKLKKYEDEMKLKEKTIAEVFTKVVNMENDTYQLFNQVEEDFEVVKSQVKVSLNKKEITSQETIKTRDDTTNRTKNLRQENRQLTQMVERLHQSSKLIGDLPGFRKLAKELEEKAGRLKHKGFTVALFGAFSAGKSSFANALMGERILPVSPNPTTAAINKIKPVTAAFQHGTVLVKFKDEAAMLEDVNHSLKVFQLQARDFDEASNKIDQIILQKEPKGVLEQTHFAFLKAFNKSSDSLLKLLGTIMETDLNDFSEFVSKEEKSCYVEWIELYYDCELTRKGITLVDTPGADSINARHTGVSFDYIKNSDAILFVTYYNHAFSKADREFLIQLGRVKDSFQLDKMFFIINAIDLAENEEEKEMVADYVKEQLAIYGIRYPHLYSLSSLLAIQEKIQPSTPSFSRMGDFEDAFYQFISNDLTEMAITSSANELGRIQKMIGKLIQNSKEDQSVKKKKMMDIEKQKDLIRGLIEKQTVENIQKRMLQEAEELIYYIKQRVFFRFNDFFKESFNTSTLRDDGRNLKKVLETALDEFLESLGFDLAQEMRATTVRLDRFVGKVLAEYQSALTRNLHEINEDLSFAVFEMKNEDEIDFPSAFKNVNKQMFAKAMSYFKNPKSFFEKNEKEFMSDELNHVLGVLADDYLGEESIRLNRYYSKWLTNEFKCLISQMSKEKDEFYLSLLSALTGGVSIERLETIQQKLKGL